MIVKSWTRLESFTGTVVPLELYHRESGWVILGHPYSPTPLQPYTPQKM
jgi:hypothetical protein